MRELSCALLVMSRDREHIFGCHCTGRKFEKATYDLPKGHVEPFDADDLATAIRECREETGFDFTPYKNDIKDLGVFKYNPTKDLHIFYIEYDFTGSQRAAFHCDSTFTDQWGRVRPEVDNYKFFTINEIDWFFKSLQPILKKILL